MKKPTTLPPPKPKPRPPPKPKECPPKSATIGLSGKPIIPPKPRRRTPPSIPTNQTSTIFPVKADFVDGKNDLPPKRPFKPLHLVIEANDVSDNVESGKPEINHNPDYEDNDLYDDVNVDSTDLPDR